MPLRHETDRRPRRWRTSVRTAQLERRSKHNIIKLWKTYPPFATRVHYTVAQDQAACPAHEISATEFLHNIWVGVPAVRADQTDGEVRSVVWLLGALGRCEREGLGGHGIFES